MLQLLARLHIDGVSGYGDYARCYELTPHIFDGGFSYKYLTIVVRAGDVHVIRATSSGHPAGITVDRATGSFTPNGNPHDSEDHLNGCFVWALAANGYQIEGYGDRSLPEGLDYDPDDLPEE
ncbi:MULTISPECIES: hypothetical protein [Nocardia]|uniref:hypothetical protein n=1 Tax=Nocardia TaxID=1817 RepID=UPI0007A43E5C|nr:MULTISPECIES: hypothetical protein [Nocardia]